MRRTAWSFLRDLKTDLPDDPVIPLLRIYPSEIKSAYKRGICTPRLIVAYFKIAKICNQLKCLSTDNRIKVYTYIHTREYYSATKKNEILSFAKKKNGSNCNLHSVK